MCPITLEDGSISTETSETVEDATFDAETPAKVAKPCKPEQDALTEVPVKLSDSLKHHLEADYNHASKKLKPNSLPAEPCIVAVLENYVRHYANAQLLAYEKQRSKTFYTAYRKENKQYFDKALDSISLAKEVAEGLRIMIDFYLEKHLLYESERSQFEAARKKAKERPQKKAEEKKKVTLRERRKCMKSEVVTAAASPTPDPPESSKDSVVSGNSSVQLPSLLTPPGSTPNTPQSIQVLRTIQDWRLIPDDRHNGHLASVIGGPIHLLRLFVKLPEILFKMKMPPKTSKLIVKYMDSVLEYLDSNPDLFGSKSH